MNLVLLAIIAVLTAGFAKLIANTVNWMCSFRIAKQLVVADKMLNVLLVTSYPAILGWLILPVFGHTASASGNAYVWILALLGLVGLAPLLRATIYYWRYAPPACEINVESKLVDFRATITDWKNLLVDRRGKNFRVALLPGNEQLTLQVSTKTYEFVDLPPEWNGLSIVHLSDLHFLGGLSRRYFELVCEQAVALQGDLIVFTGDLIDRPRFVEWFAPTLGTLTAPMGRYYILGNHDWYHEPDRLRDEFRQHGWTNLSGRYINIPSSSGSGTPLILCGDETPWMGTHPDLSDASLEAFRVLLSHTPDNIEWARKNGIDLMLAGHTHGGQIRLPILGPVYSPSRYGVRFASGVFWMEPTLMYVTRGISGKEPVRYNCPPELTKIVLTRKP